MHYALLLDLASCDDTRPFLLFGVLVVCCVRLASVPRCSSIGGPCCDEAGGILRYRPSDIAPEVPASVRAATLLPEDCFSFAFRNR